MPPRRHLVRPIPQRQHRRVRLPRTGAGGGGRCRRGARALLGTLDTKACEHQPHWVARAHARRLAGDAAHATHAQQRAIRLTADERVRRFLREGVGRSANGTCPSTPIGDGTGLQP